MPLMKCPECENEISDKVDTVCPKCGYKHDEEAISTMNAKNRTPLEWFKILFLYHSVYTIVTILIYSALGVQNGKLIVGAVIAFSLWYVVIGTSIYIAKKVKAFFLVWNTICLIFVASGILYKI